MDQKIANRYQLLETLGSGGFGRVYKARDELLGRFVAVKGMLLDVDYSEITLDSKKFILNEARMMARFHHPNILPIYDIVEDGEALYIVMPIIVNNLSALNETIREKPLMEIIRLFERIADGLDFLHQYQILHRDLKPTNIFFGDDDQPYIADFSLAEPTDFSPPEDNVAGTIFYMAPETFMGTKASISSDVFAFGIILFEIITGHHPFEADGDINQVVMAILQSETPSIGEYRPELSKGIVRDIDVVMAKLTAKEPHDRYETAKKAIDDLYRIMYSVPKIVEGKLFISYARKDQDFVYQLANELKRYNVSLWFDREIEFGSAWDQTIDDQLADCDAMLLVTTPSSMESAYVTYEWSYFMGTKKPVFPFVPKIANADVKFHARLKRLQYIRGTDDLSHDVRAIITVMSQAIERRKKQQAQSKVEA